MWFFANGSQEKKKEAREIMSKANHLLIGTLKSLIQDREREIEELERKNVSLRKENVSLKKRLSSQEGCISRGDSTREFFEERLN